MSAVFVHDCPGGAVVIADTLNVAFIACIFQHLPKVVFLVPSYLA